MSAYRKIEVERQEMNRHFDQRIKELQSSCAHEELTDWLVSKISWYGPTKYVQLCKNCQDVINRKTVDEFCY